MTRRSGIRSDAEISPSPHYFNAQIENDKSGQYDAGQKGDSKIAHLSKPRSARDASSLRGSCDRLVSAQQSTAERRRSGREYR
jgi:hypothetical protein